MRDSAFYMYEMVRCCRRRVALRPPRRNFHVEAANRLDAGQLRPCRTADSIFLHSSRPPLVSCFVCLCPSLSLFPLFQDSVRAYNYRRHASPRTLLKRASTESSLPPHPQSIPRLLRTALRLFYSSPSSSLILGRSLDLYRGLAGLLHPSSTSCWRGPRGTPLPYDFHVSASGPQKPHDRALYLT